LYTTQGVKRERKESVDVGGTKRVERDNKPINKDER